jgi:hypothetical protein
MTQKGATQAETAAARAILDYASSYDDQVLLSDDHRSAASTKKEGPPGLALRSPSELMCKGLHPITLCRFGLMVG